MQQARIRTLWLGACAALVGLAASPLAAAKSFVVYGASGAIGGVIVQEALDRGDTVIGVARDTSKMKFDSPHFKAVEGDVTDLESFRKITAGADAVIISVVGSGKDNLPENSVHAQAAAVAVKAFTGVKNAPYVLEIGGASTLYETKEGVLSHLPFKAEPGSAPYGMFLGHLVALETFRASSIRWTVLTPPPDLQGWKPNGPPELHRTGKFRTSTTGFVVDGVQKGAANVADLAVAAVDEVEHPRFVGKRFTIGY